MRDLFGGPKIVSASRGCWRRGFSPHPQGILKDSLRISRTFRKFPQKIRPGNLHRGFLKEISAQLKSLNRRRYRSRSNKFWCRWNRWSPLLPSAPPVVRLLLFKRKLVSAPFRQKEPWESASRQLRFCQTYYRTGKNLREEGSGGGRSP